MTWHGLAEMTNNPQVTPRPVAILIFPGAQVLDATGPLSVLTAANQLPRDSGQPSPYDVRVISLRPGPVTTSSGLALMAEAPPEGPLDTLIIAGGPGVRAIANDPETIDWVRHHAAQARRTASVCTGAFLLAATGLLDGHRVTTHWAYCAHLAERFPALRVEADPIYLTDGRLWTSAGVTAGIDMTLALLEADLGGPAAMTVARRLVVFARRPGGQSQFSERLALSATDARFDALHQWIADNLSRPLRVPDLAGQAGMSERSFIRWYRTVTGITPAHAVERLRVEAARNDLGSGGAPIKDVARRRGFGSEETMRRSFLRVLGVPPGAYRERFRA